MLTADRLRSLYHYDLATGVWTRLISRRSFRAGTIAGYLTTKGYLAINIDGRRYLAHRLAFLYVEGIFPTSQVDHIDCNKANCAWVNLRKATVAENAMNVSVRRTNQSGLKGAHLRKDGRYRSSICVGGQRLHLGHFDSAQNAHDAYARAAARYHGEFARSA